MNMKLLIEASTVNGLIDYLWSNTTSGDNALVKEILNEIQKEDFEGTEMLKKKMKNREILGNVHLDCETAVPHPIGVKKVFTPWMLEKQEETETTMRYGDQPTCAPYACASIAQVSPETSEQKAQQYLLSSLEQAIWTKRDEESKAFYMNGTAPQTLGELREAIKNGWVTIPEDYKDEDDDMSLIFGVSSYVFIGDPSKKSDPKGFEKARNLIKLDADGVRDQIMVMGSELGLKALNEFKAKSYH